MEYTLFSKQVGYYLVGNKVGYLLVGEQVGYSPAYKQVGYPPVDDDDPFVSNSGIKIELVVQIPVLSEILKSKYECQKEPVLPSLNGKVQGARAYFSCHNFPKLHTLADRSRKTERL